MRFNKKKMQPLEYSVDSSKQNNTVKAVLFKVFSLHPGYMIPDLATTLVLKCTVRAFGVGSVKFALNDFVS